MARIQQMERDCVMKNVVEQDQLLHTHAAVRIHPPNSLTEGKWVVSHLSEHRRLAISPNVCAILVAFMGGQSLLEAYKEVTETLDMPLESFGKYVVILMQKGLLVSENNPDHIFAYNIAKQWSRYGWGDAADYHIATFDYPFYDYSDDGYQQDTVLMNQYVTKEPDINRTKEYTAAVHLEVPNTRDALDSLTTSFRTLWNDPTTLQSIDVHHIKTLMATAFGRLRSRRIRGMSGRADLVRKTSPSGGSRHPIEGYVVVQAVPGIDAGIYHFSVGEHVLEYIGKPLSDNELALIFLVMKEPHFIQEHMWC